MRTTKIIVSYRDYCPFLRRTNKWQDPDDPIYSGCDYECEHPNKKDGNCVGSGVGCPLKKYPVLITTKAKAE